MDNDPRLTILHTPLTIADGYYNSRDEYPRQIRRRSNQREMIYIDGSRLKVGNPPYLGVLAHELQHAVHWNLDSGEEAWVHEGMSEVAKELAGYPARKVDAFLLMPDTQLNYWPIQPLSTAPHYGAAALFLTYMAQRFGGYEGLKELVKGQADGVDGIEAYLSKYGATFVDVFKDWVIANYLSAPEGRYGYSDRSIRVREFDFMFVYGEKKDTLPQFATRYIDLRLSKGDVVVSFQGESKVAQVGTECYSSRHCWWGNRGDSIDSTLTREFDLSDVTAATLEFWTWFDLEYNRGLRLR